MTKEEQARLKELVAKKKAKTLTDAESKELDELNQKAGYKGKKHGEKKPKDKPSFTPGNDFSWWNKEPELLKDAANFKCNMIAGQPIAAVDIPYVIPGVVAIELESVYGSDYQATDGINVWARDLYLRMFQKYRPVSQYTAADLGITLIAENEVVKLIAKYERIYGVVNRYSKLNVNMPGVECNALGLTVSEVAYLQSHMSDFRYDLNFLIKKAQRLCIPKDMSVIADAISLFGYEYQDHENPRAQIIIFDTHKFGLYDETTVSSGGAIQFNDIDSSTPLFDFNADNMCNVLDIALNALISSDSVQRILADLVVWFGEGAMLQFAPVPEDYLVAPVYSESILHKMHNLETLQNFGDQIVSWADNALSTADQSVILNGQHWIYQVNDRIVTRIGAQVTGGTHAPITYSNGKILGSNAGYPQTPNVCHLLDTYRVDVDPETITEGVLFKYATDNESDGTSYVKIFVGCCFYIAKSIAIMATNNAGTYMCNMVSNNTTIAAQNAGLLAILDWAPLVYNLSTSQNITYVYGDLDNVVPLYRNDMAKLSRTIVLSGLKTDVQTINK